MSKPRLLEELDTIIAAKLNMTTVAAAETSVIDDCYMWMKDQPEFQDVEMRSCILYRGVMINPANTPIGEIGYVIQQRTNA